MFSFLEILNHRKIDFINLVRPKVVEMKKTKKLSKRAVKVKMHKVRKENLEVMSSL